MFMSFYKFSIRLYLYCTICTCIFKVIREKIILVQYVHEFLKLEVLEAVDKVNPHFTLFDPANMIPTLGNRGLPNSVMLCCQPRATSISSG